MTSVLDEFRTRDMLQDATEGASDHFDGAPRTVYVGFDPTAPSLHLGNLVPIMGLVHAQRAGHTPIALVGGGTGLIGDPSGKTAERLLLTKERAEDNAASIRAQLEHFLDFDAKSNAARMRNNLDWLGGLALVDFLRDIPECMARLGGGVLERVTRSLPGLLQFLAVVCGVAGAGDQQNRDAPAGCRDPSSHTRSGMIHLPQPSARWPGVMIV